MAAIVPTASRAYGHKALADEELGQLKQDVQATDLYQVCAF